MTDTVVSLDFKHAKSAVAKQFELMKQRPLLRVSATKDEMWDTYLKSFPPGTNPIFRERTEHDCACCRHFIRDIGNVVAVVNGRLVTVWDRPTGEDGYDAVFAAMRKLILSKPIVDVFLHDAPTAGTDKNLERNADGSITTWNHFHVTVPQAYVRARTAIATELGRRRSSHDVFERALKELTVDALDTVLELTAQNSLYRGEEFAGLVQKFRELKTRYDIANEHEKKYFTWVASTQESEALTHIRNSAIGTLLVNLSEGMEIEMAVKAYETVVAPTNYKRPTALVTKAMVARAREDIEKLGLTSALERRHAVLSDISVNNVLFADRSAKRVMQDVFDEVAATSAKTVKSVAEVEEVPVEKFIKDVLPKIESMEVLVENTHQPNFVSLIAPQHKGAGLLFKWPNPFSWSYVGEVADSIKERVKAAGGNVTGDLCCRLAWHNYDDLDFHMIEPDGERIYFAHRRSTSNGCLDVDMNAGWSQTRTPVENIFYPDRHTMKEGEYRLIVNQYNPRETRDRGFEVEIDWMGEVFQYASPASPAQGANEVVARFKYSKKDGLTMLSSITSKRASKQVWGVATEQYQRVNVMLLSPNYWDDQQIGNKHYMFMLDGCVNDGTARGFYNEFLMPVVAEHRKVLEIVGSKTKPVPATEQLSGLGFSSTKRNHLYCRVKGSFTRTIKIVF